MKKLILILVSIAASAVFAAVTIRDTSRSFEFGGGGAIISTDGSGTWTASADVSWLTITTTSGNAGKGVPYLVAANNSADVRVGHITVAGNVYTVTQNGRMVELSPATVEVGSEGASGEIALVTDANVTWTVRSAEGWITILPANGIGPGTLTYTIQPFDGVGSRSGSITVGSQTIPVTQTGIDVNLTPVSTNVPYTVTMIPVIVDAMADQAWTVKQNDSWLSIVDAGTGRGGSQVMLCAAENPSYEKRTGTVSIGTGKVTVIQDGTSDLSFKILPEVATASPLGAFGNVAVYATPDATWTAESLADWIHISSGEAGAGNGNVKYVANANLDLSSRTGQIKFTPPAFVPDVDLYRGLLFWIKDQKNIEGNELRQATYSLSKAHDGSFYNQLTGADIPAFGNGGYALSFSFKVGQLDCINRLLKLQGHSVYLDEENILWYHTLATDLAVSEAGACYTMVISVDEKHQLKIYAGEKGSELRCVRSPGAISGYLDFSAAKGMSNFKFGYCEKPSTGNLGNGQFADIRFWTRALTDRECELVDVKQDELVDKKPSVVFEKLNHDYFPLVGNAVCNDESMVVSLNKSKNVYLSGWLGCDSRARVPNGAVSSSGEGRIVFSEFEKLFCDGEIVYNHGKELSKEDGSHQFVGVNSSYYYPWQPTVSGSVSSNSTYVFWIKVDELPVNATSRIFQREWTTLRDYSVEYKTLYSVSYDTNLLLAEILENGCLSIKEGIVLSGSDWDGYYAVNDGLNEIFRSASPCPLGKWFMFSVSSKDGKVLTLYLDGKEIGSVYSSASLGFVLPCDMRWIPTVSTDGSSMFRDKPWGRYGTDFLYEPISISDYCSHDFLSSPLLIGGWKGSIDDITFYNKALSAKEIKAIYDAGVVDDAVYHTVTQGVIEPTLSTYSVNMPKGGGNANVSLTLAKGVNWTATTSASWLSIAGDTSGAGSAEFTIKVAANPTVKTRTGTVTIAGKTVKVTQEPLACEVICDNPVFGTAGDMGTIVVNPELGGSWTATTDEDWIYIVDGESGTGSGNVWFITEGYDDTTGSRTGVIKIGEEKVYITQRGFELSINPMVAEVGGNAGAGRIGVSADLNAVWTALAQEDWIEIVTGGEGIGDGTVVYRVKDNTTGQTRTGHIYISGQVYTITQTCTLKLTASVVGNGSVNGAGDYSQGKVVTLRAVPDAGNVFSHWSGDVVGNDDVTTVKMDSVKNVTATFIPEAAAQKLAEQKAAQGGFYTRDQIHALEMGNLVFDVDASGTARVGVQLMETSDLTDPNSWKPATLNGNPDVGQDGTVGMKVKAEGNAKFFKVVMPQQQ